ncbi:MAG: trypsin-like peptidase domain-containing protein [Chloroflexi bacterium]|nr:trypsin-like peptidase domain-containing protein [Chloroflexota bacterium]
MLDVDQLPPEQRKDLDRNSTLNLNLAIVRLDGHLLPGASGAPLLDGQGRVAAVGNGGLSHGAASISWAVPARHLDDLLEIPERAMPASSSSNLFAAPTAEWSRAGRRTPSLLQCGGIDFVVSGTRGFEQLRMGTDDPAGLARLVIEIALAPTTLRSFGYRIYTRVNDGAAIAVPAWMSVRRTGAHCEARSADGGLVVAFGGSRVTAPAMAHAASVVFERDVLTRTGRYWELDTNYAYATPLWRFDGFAATRKAWFTNDGGPQAWSFETLMTKHSTFAGVLAVYYNHNRARVQYCRFQLPNDPRCAGFEREFADFSQTILGVHLSTFPIY